MLDLSGIKTLPNPEDRRDPAGRFPKGTSGNPAGRPRGSRNKATILMEQLIEQHGADLLRKEFALAKKGDRYARRFCLTQLYPAGKERPVELDLPSVAKLEGLVEALSRVVEAMAAGQISPSAAAQYTTLLKLQHEVMTHADFESRIEALEHAFDLEAARDQANHRQSMAAMAEVRRIMQHGPR